jgi:rhodanese-related sulfurtransferase
MNINCFTKGQILAFAMLLFGICCFGQVKSGAYRVMLRGLLSHTVPEIDVQQAVNTDKPTVYLDAREQKEYAVSHIQGAIPVGYDHFDLQSVQSIPKDQPIIVYCSVGYRSEKVAEKLLKAGFSNVHNLYGGIFEWVNQAHPVVNDTGPTEQVHGFNRTWGVWLRRGKKVY